MKNTFYSFLCLLILTSCSTKKDILYFQDYKTNQNSEIQYIAPKIQVNDILSIRVSAIIAESVIPFNVQKDNKDGSSQQEGYLVDVEGNITFPLLGKINVLSKTTIEAEEIIKEKLVSNGFLINPTISVRVVNGKITILGSINGPGTYNFPEANITLLQAIGYASDLNIKGTRDNILIIREEDGKRTYGTVDLRKTDWLNGPYYYVRPNDVIYIKPNGPQIKSAGFITTWTGVLSIFSTALTLYLITTR